MNPNDQMLGIEFKTDSHHVFFGTKYAKKNLVQKRFNDYEFRFLKQVHGNRVVPSSSTLQEADGHWSSEKFIGLSIVTADCLPIMLATNQLICAIHAGWRGLEQEIIHEAIRRLSSQPSGPIQAYIGPHILKWILS